MSILPDIEVVETRNAGWAWRCHTCDITRTGLDEPAARIEARDHGHSTEHRDPAFPGEPAHGTLARYSTRRYLCRCSECRTAMAEYQRGRREVTR